MMDVQEDQSTPRKGSRQVWDSHNPREDLI